MATDSKGSSSGTSAIDPVKNPKGLKPCCACPETKKARDTCFFETGDDAETKCHYLIQAHRRCMEDLGFKI